MRLITDRSPGAYAVRVPCLKCGNMVLLAHAFIDVDGPAFAAYYHPDCVPVSFMSHQTTITKKGSRHA